MDAISSGKTQAQINVKLFSSEKEVLIALAKKKGAGGLTGLLKMLAKAKRVDIIL